MTEELLTQLLITAPNLAFAVWCLWWSFRRMEQMMALHERLIDKLVARLSVEDTQELRALTEEARSLL